MVYAAGSRADLIARLIEVEIEQARELSLSFPLPRDPRLQRLCAGLLADPADRRTLQQWAEVAGASARTLARLFERDLAMSFDQWRRRVRFQGALEALAQGEPITRVAETHGYLSASAFSQAFAKVMGKPPSRYGAEA